MRGLVSIKHLQFTKACVAPSPLKVATTQALDFSLAFSDPARTNLSSSLAVPYLMPHEVHRCHEKVANTDIHA